MMRGAGQEIRQEGPLQTRCDKAAFAFRPMWLLLPILLVLHVVVCLLLVLVVLMQLPRSEGLGAAFGGAVTENIFGAQTTHVLARFTVWLGVAFFAITLLLAIAYSRRDVGRSGIQRELLNSAAPAASPAPTSSPAASSAEASAPAAATPASSSPAAATPASSPPAAGTPAPAGP
jgi:preprotein translocase subunit SecG